MGALTNDPSAPAHPSHNPAVVAGQRGRGSPIARGLAWTTIEIWARQLIQAASFILLARLLEPEAWGIVGIALAFVAIGTVLVADGGWVAALVRAPVLSEELEDTVFWAAMLVALALAGALVAGADVIARWFAVPELAPVLRCLCVAIPLEALGVVPRARLLREFAFARLAARSLIGVTTGGVVGVALVLAGAGLWGLVAYQVFQPIAEAIVLWLASSWRPGRTASRAALRQLAGFLGQVAAERACSLVDVQLPRLLLGHLLGPAALGIYTLARRMTELGTELVSIPVGRVSLPIFAAASADFARLQPALKLSIEWFASSAMPAFLGLAVLAEDLVPLLFGAQWAAAVPALQLALLLGPAMGLAGILRALLLALGHGQAVFRLALGGTALLAAMLLALPTVSVTAVMLVLLARTYLLLPIRLLIAARYVEMEVVEPSAGHDNTAASGRWRWLHSCWPLAIGCFPTFPRSHGCPWPCWGEP